MDKNNNSNNKSKKNNDMISKSLRRVINNVPIIPRSKCQIESLLGYGSFCNVYQATIDNDDNNNNNNNIIINQAVKKQSNEQESDQPHYYALKGPKKEYAKDGHVAADLILEASILSSMPQHENIIQLFGITILYSETKSIFIILEQVTETLQDKLNEWRSIHQYVTQQQQKSATASLLRLVSKQYRTTSQKKHLQSLQIQMKNRIQSTVFGICNGMDFLSQHGIVHRDLKPANVGITNDGTIKLLDFGFARSLSDLDSWKSETAGTLRYMAPELVLKRTFEVGLPLDVYSFGMLLYEISTLSEILPEINIRQEYKQKVCIEGMRPNLDNANHKRLSLRHNKKLQHLLKSCWNENPSIRPSFYKIQHELNDSIQEISCIILQQQDNKQCNNEKKEDQSKISSWLCRQRTKRQQRSCQIIPLPSEES